MAEHDLACARQMTDPCARAAPLEMAEYWARLAEKHETKKQLENWEGTVLPFSICLDRSLDPTKHCNSGCHGHPSQQQQYGCEHSPAPVYFHLDGNETVPHPNIPLRKTKHSFSEDKTPHLGLRAIGHWTQSPENPCNTKVSVSISGSQVRVLVRPPFPARSKVM
jgi:hypothetical protein